MEYGKDKEPSSEEIIEKFEKISGDFTDLLKSSPQAEVDWLSQSLILAKQTTLHRHHLIFKTAMTQTKINILTFQDMFLGSHEIIFCT